jgi:hypothetical protein
MKHAIITSASPLYGYFFKPDPYVPEIVKKPCKNPQLNEDPRFGKYARNVGRKSQLA